MRLKWLVILLVLGLTACGSKPFVITNACENTTVTVLDGNGQVLIVDLKFGESRTPELKGHAGTRIELLAKVFNAAGVLIRTRTQTLTLPYDNNNGGRGSFSPTGPDQLPPWTIGCGSS